MSLLREHKKDHQAELALRGELTILDGLKYLQLRDKGAEIVAEFLKDNKTVLQVVLRRCFIGPRGGYAIAKSLKHNRTVEVLNLVNNFIGKEGADALIEALNYNVCIKEIYIGHGVCAPHSTATIEYLTKTRNKVLIPAAVRRTCLHLIAARRTITGAGDFAVVPKEIVKLIATKVWATRTDPVWIEAIDDYEDMVRQKDFIDKWMREKH